MKRASDSYNWPFYWIVLLSAGFCISVRADSSVQYSFPTIWKLVRSRSGSINAAIHELESSRLQETRTSRHWYPRVFTEGRAFSTNDPALTFMSLLGQRQIGVSDFAPAPLNQPGSSFFERGTLGLDLPLFEGGSRFAQASASSKLAEAKSFELQTAELTQFAELASVYSSILTLQRQLPELERLREGVEDTLAHYKIGTKSNPVGYSGLLGLKNLRNRLEGLATENFAKMEAYRLRILITANGGASELPENWMPKQEDAKEFIEKNLNRKVKSTQGAGMPTSVRAMHLNAESLEAAKDAENARFLPKVGLFGTGDLYGGNRTVATSYTAGAYMQWDLFSAPNFGAIAQAEHNVAAAFARADAMKERARIDEAMASQSANALEKNLSLMNESAGLLQEQTTTARGLFKNGSINALQLVEVLSRRADLLVSRTEAELSLAQARAALFVNSSSEGVSRED